MAVLKSWEFFGI